jgi:hypothetical protein
MALRENFDIVKFKYHWKLNMITLIRQSLLLWLTYYGEIDTEVPGGGINEVYSTPEDPFILHPDVIHL